MQEHSGNSKKVIIFLHGGGLAQWNFTGQAQLLQEKFNVIIPPLDGHSGSDIPFTTISANADRVISYIDKNFGGQVYTICGLSLGGQILVDILSKRGDICEFAVIESALVYPMKITNTLVDMAVDISYGLVSKRWFSKLQFKSLKINKCFFEEYYLASQMISKESLKAILKSNSSYKMNRTIGKTSAKVLVLVGSKERRIMKKSAVLLSKTIPGAKLEILKGYTHGEISINRPQEYVGKITQFFTQI